MIKKAQALINQYDELSKKISDPEIINNHTKLIALSKQQSEIELLYKKSIEYIKAINTLEENKLLFDDSDADIVAMAEQENDIIGKTLLDLESELKILFIPKDPNDKKNIILEIRAGTGGSEACLFANDLYRMYIRYAELKGWKAELMNLSDNEGGGIKEGILAIKGSYVYRNMKFESGVHRVQRVPDTESSGRLHTNAATVAVLPEAESVDIEINDADIKIDTYRASGAGGQHVNKTDSAVRLTHVPTGTVVQCQNDRSQHKNKDNAFKQLKSKLYELELQKQKDEQQVLEDSKSDIGWGSQIRSYVLDQSRIKDLRTNVESGNISSILDGDIDIFIKASLTQGV